VKIIETLKAAFPTLVFTGVGITTGYQLIMVLAGAGIVLEHRINYGRWWDKGKLICHGKFGVWLLTAGCCVTVLGILS